MIHVETTGGLGNQLFVYALARAEQLTTGEPVCVHNYDRFDVSHAKMLLQHIVPEHLDVTYVPHPRSEKLWALAPVRSFLCRVLHRLYRVFHPVHTPAQQLRLEAALQPVWNWLGVSIITHGYLPISHRTPFRDRIYRGYFQSSRFYGPHAEQIRRELCRPELITGKNAALLEDIRSTNSVCVHIRLGDYLSDPEARKTLYVCDTSYYSDALRRAWETLTDPVFYVFTNDVEGTRKVIFPPEAKVVFIPGDNGAIEDLQLMAQCQHYVIGNSTFGWWGQFLSENKQRQVFAPDRWFRTDLPADQYEPFWTRIPVTLPEA